jgi:ATP synthase protein I
MREDETVFSRQVAAKAARKLEAERLGEPQVWSGLGMFGMVGWSIALPTVLGALLGAWLDRYHARGYSWTLMLLVAGLVVGCATAWHWVSSQSSAAAPPPRDPNA